MRIPPKGRNRTVRACGASAPAYPTRRRGTVCYRTADLCRHAPIHRSRTGRRPRRAPNRHSPDGPRRSGERSGPMAGFVNRGIPRMAGPLGAPSGAPDRALRCARADRAAWSATRARSANRVREVALEQWCPGLMARPARFARTRAAGSLSCPTLHPLAVGRWSARWCAARSLEAGSGHPWCHDRSDRARSGDRDVPAARGDPGDRGGRAASRSSRGSHDRACAARE